ncbi:predicted protein [Chaetoceros tenuissimus]|uniref:Uncharacterized protein n=1 Tax=Chaetoceros tenuissimus TaxID=426638 RepID=A0AAD3CYA2_9STRA|nr:predicted protein [Chaetoceros tenuissimus]
MSSKSPLTPTSNCKSDKGMPSPSDGTSSNSSLLERFPLQILSSNTIPSDQHDSPTLIINAEIIGGGEVESSVLHTPLSTKSKSSTHNRKGGNNYDYINSYVINLDDDDSDGENEESEIDLENDASTIGHSTISSSQRQLDADSFVYSGYAGSVSAAPSELSFGYSVDEDVEALSIQKTKSHKKNKRSRRRGKTPRFVQDVEMKYFRDDDNDGDDSTNYTEDQSATDFSFTAMMKKQREKRRRTREESQKAHKATILSEFREFLSRNKRPVEEQKQTVNLKANDNIDLENDKNEEGGFQFTPTKIHGDVPWIVFQNDREEDLSTINGGGDSRCGGMTSIELQWTNIDNESKCDNFNREKNELKSSTNTNNMSSKRKHEIFYMALIAISIITLIVVVTVVVIYI